ncbi:hypothetical protein EV715DRAFT_268225 [Schizophyllum commune]
MVNPNIATITTSKGLADKVYFLFEQPNGIYVTFGRQIALNVGIKLKDEFEEWDVQALGTQVNTIIMAGQQLFADTMAEIGEKCAESGRRRNRRRSRWRRVSGSRSLWGRPVGAICEGVRDESASFDWEEYEGGEEIKYEVVRDCRDNCITVCSLENVDPLGIHPDNSFVAVPSQTLSDSDYNMLRTTAINNVYVKDIDEDPVNSTDKRAFAISTAFHRGHSVEKVWQMTNFDKLIHDVSTFDKDVLRRAKQLGFSDRELSACMTLTELAFPAFPNYLYTTYDAIEHDDITFEDRGVMALGFGVYRIGSFVEFDRYTVRAIRTLRDQGETQSCEKVGYLVLVRSSKVLSGACDDAVSAGGLFNAVTRISREQSIVITKYIEQAREIEMDAVAKGGEMIFLFISKHIENTDALRRRDAHPPPQDLDSQTVKQIEEATAKIESTVIECNLCAARSFPFVWKVLGIDAIEMATKAMLELPVESYPDANLPPDHVGVEVPSCSCVPIRCWVWRWRPPARALISTNIVAPIRNVLFSVGNYRAKRYLLTIRKLSAAGYIIFATSGTADFLTEHIVPCKLREQGSPQLPYGCRLRDTDCRECQKGKMLAEAEASKLRLDVLTGGSKSSHLNHTFPGFVALAASVSELSQAVCRVLLFHYAAHRDIRPPNA